MLYPRLQKLPFLRRRQIKVFGSLFSKSEWEFEGNALMKFLQAGF